jgi:hypothetical protein
MHDETTRERPDDAIARAEGSLLHLLLAEPHPFPWAVEELTLAHGNHRAAIDAIAGLHAHGLIHLIAGYAWPTRAAVNASQLEGGV